ncbi:MAG TPA: homoserine O-acetyltransferase, partial [Rhodothermales bacterium]
YGTVSPTSIRPDTGTPYGADFPAATIRDTVALHRLLLEHLGIRRVAMTIGGSMGGMQVLEWGFHPDLVGALVPIGVGGRHSAWCIAWSEAQRQAIYADPNWKGGRYEAGEGPDGGLSAARMMAMVSYRSRASFESRFGRARMAANEHQDVFAVESYLRYQGEKLVQRFDANCYVHLTRQMDSHDVSRGRGGYPDVLRSIRQPTLVIGIDTDVLYPVEEQEELAAYMPDATLQIIEAEHGHDSFLIAFEQLDEVLRPFMERVVAPAVGVPEAGVARSA